MEGCLRGVWGLRGLEFSGGTFVLGGGGAGGDYALEYLYILGLWRLL